MKKNIWILALAVTALFAACSKNDDLQPIKIHKNRTNCN